MTEIYIAKADTLLGIKKGDEIVYDSIAKTSTVVKNGQLLPFDVKAEKKFFATAPSKPVSKYQIGDGVHLTVPYNLDVLSGPVRTAGRKFKMQAYLQLRVVNISLTLPNDKRKKPDFYYSLQFGNFVYKLPSFDEKFLHTTAHYWFISSKGVISTDVVGRDPDAEKFRAKMANYFTTKTEAQTAFSKL